MTADPVLASVQIDAPPERVYEYFVNHRPCSPGWVTTHCSKPNQVAGSISTSKARQYAATTWISNRHTGWSSAGATPAPTTCHPARPLVEVRFTADRGGTRVDLEHRDLQLADRPAHVVGWIHYLGRLQIAAPGGDPGPDPGMPAPA